MSPFTYSNLPQRVVFGAGALASLTAEIQLLGATRALVLSTPEQAALAHAVKEQIGEYGVGVLSQARMHVPVEVARQAIAQAKHLKADCVIAVGGGSTIGLGKAIALESGLPVVAVPTTYAGSEVTSIYGLTEAGIKKTGRDLRVLPKTVIYDPELTLTLPVGMSIVSGLNGIAHAAESLYAHDGNPIVALLAEEGIRAVAAALPVLGSAPSDLTARSNALYGAWLCGTVLGQVSMGLHHKLCHTLGGSFDLPHAETHAVVLPHALAYNAEAAPQAMRAITRALGLPADTVPVAAAQAMFEFTKALGAPTALKQIGFARESIDKAAALACEAKYSNPRPLEIGAIRALLQRAYAGEAPCA